MCSKADEVIEFCKKVFDAKVDEISRGDDGSVRHATIHIRDSAVMLSEARGEYPATPIMLYIYVDNVDEVYKKAIAAKRSITKGAD